jgi:phosphatidylinositol alpha 1,6-mannosyltransferase
MPSGEYRGWTDRLAQLLAHSRADRAPFRYANLAVRSRRVAHLVDEQVPRALALRPDLVSILIGANDLVGRAVDPIALAAVLAGAVRTLRDAGIDVLLVTPFLPRRRAAVLFARRFAVYASELRRIAADTGAILLDLDALPAIGELELWADDKVHLRSRGHRFLAYRAAEALGVPDAEALGGLDAALHAEDDPIAQGTWLRRDALPWVWRRLRGRTAGDGLDPKHADYVLIGGDGQVRSDVRAG